MRKIFLPLIFLVLMPVCREFVYANGNAGTIIDNSSAQKVYYVVLGSFSTLESAHIYNNNLPDGMESWIYKCTSNGKTVYRVCFSCFSTRQKAQEQINWFHSYDVSWFTDAWIWESDGLGNCVFCPVSYETEETLPPLSPK